MRKKSWLLGLAAMFVMSACTDDGKLDADDFPDTTVEPVVTLTEEEKSISDATRAWNELWRESEKIVRKDEPAIERGEKVATVEVVEQLKNRPYLDLDEQRFVDNYPVITENSDGTLTVNDCMVWSLPDLEGIAKWWEGELTQDSDGVWQVTALTLKEDGGCIPRELNDEILADYAESIEAQKKYWNPANPDDPGLEKTMTRGMLTDIKDKVSEDQERGFYLTRDPEIHPEITEFKSSTFVKITDCYTDDTAGLFDADGNRQEGISEREPGQRSISDVTLILVQSQWKVADRQGQEKWECEFAPTEKGLPIV